MSLVARALRSALLEPVDLEVADGEAVALRGPSGSGKTLLLRALADLDPNEGECFVDGRARSSMSGPAWRRLVRYVAAEPGWWADDAASHFSDPRQIRRRLADLALPPDVLDRPLSQLSTGEKQRLALLRALEDHPRVLLLDEPTAALDEESEAAVESLLRRLMEEGVSLFIATHNDAQAARLTSRRHVMERGALRRAG